MAEVDGGYEVLGSAAAKRFSIRGRSLLHTQLFEEAQMHDLITDIKTMSKFGDRRGVGCFYSEMVQTWPPRFVKALFTALRVATWIFLSGVLLWILRDTPVKDSAFAPPAIYFTYLADVVIACVYNVGPNLATTMRGVSQALRGTIVAIICCFLMYRIPTPPTEPLKPPTCTSPDELHQWFCVDSIGLFTMDDELLSKSAGLIASCGFAVFSLAALSANVVMPFKVFALRTAAKFMMAYASPNTAEADRLALSPGNPLTVTVVTQIFGSAIAIAAVLCPPKLAMREVTKVAARATWSTSKLLCFVTEYYVGGARTFAINVWSTHLDRNRADLQEEASNVEVAWWECFDWGTLGRTRAIMLQHVQMLRSLDRRLVLLQICAQREKFEADHTETMKPMQAPLSRLVAATGKLLLMATKAAAEGDFSEKTKEQLMVVEEDVRVQISGLAQDWCQARPKVTEFELQKTLRQESWFMLEASSAAQIVLDFSQRVTEETPPEALGVVAPYLKGVCHSKVGRNFLLRSFVTLMVTWFWACMAHDFNPALTMSAVLMLSETPGNQLLNNMQKLQATVLGSLTGHVIYRALHHCHWVAQVTKVFALFTFELLANFIANYTVEYNLIGILLAATGGSKLLAPCDEVITNGEKLLAQASEFKGLKTLVYSMVTVTAVDLVFKQEFVEKQARAKMLEVIKLLWEQLGEKYLHGEVKGSAKEVVDQTEEWSHEVETLLTSVADLLPHAEHEPRFRKGPFKTSLYKSLVDKLRATHLNAMTLIRRTLGNAQNVFPRMVACGAFTDVKDTLGFIMTDTRAVMEAVLQYEGFWPMDNATLQALEVKSGTFKLGAVSRLSAELEQALDEEAEQRGGPLEPPASLEQDMMCCCCAALEMLERLAQDFQGMLEVSLENM